MINLIVIQRSQRSRRVKNIFLTLISKLTVNKDSCVLVLGNDKLAAYELFFRDPDNLL